MNLEFTALELASILKKCGFSISCAESCTGGLASAALTSVPGSSEYFFGGIIAYSNEAKINLLQVKEDTLRRQGAVSEEVAVAMAYGAAKVFKTDSAFSITGIAGPDGGTNEKPVGTVWFGFFVRESIHAECMFFPGDRSAVRQAASRYALTNIAKLAQEKFELDNPRKAGVSFM